MTANSLGETAADAAKALLSSSSASMSVAQSFRLLPVAAPRSTQPSASAQKRRARRAGSA